MMDIKALRGTVFRGSLIIFIGNIICFILGYAREAIIVNNFGASGLSDAWYIAYNIPELLFKFLLFGAVGATFLPVFMEYLAKKREDEAWVIASSVMNFSAILLAMVAIAGMVFSSQLVRIFAPGFDSRTHELSSQLTRCVLPLLVIMGVSGLLSSIYTAYFKYAIPTLASVINIMFVVLFIALFSQRFGVFAVAFGNVFGYIIAFLVLVLFFVLKKTPYRFRIDLKHPAIREMLIIMVPLIGAEILGKGISVVDRIFASRLESGSITSLSLANRIIEMPIMFFSSTIAVVIFPVLSKCVAEGDKENLKAILLYSMKICLLVIIPCIAGIMVLGKPFVRILFERGRFSAANTDVTWEVLLYLAWGMAAFSMGPLLIRACYALKKNWMMFRYEIAAFMLNLLLLPALVTRMGIRGIALATVIAVSVITAYLLWMLKKEMGQIKLKGTGKFLCKISASAAIMAIFSYMAFYEFGARFMPGSLLFVVRFSLTVILSGFIYMIILKAFKIEELDLLWKTLKESAPGK